MTITESTEYRDSDHYKRIAADLAEQPPLPTIEEAAGPLVRALVSIHDLGAYDIGPVDRLGHSVEMGELLDEAAARLALIEGVAHAVEMAVDRVLCGPHKSMHAANARAMVLAIIDADDLRVEMSRAAHERMAYVAEATS